MGVVKLSTAGILDYQKYDSMLAGNNPYIPFISSYDLLATEILTSAQASVSFDVTGLGSTYQHLQLRWVLRSNRADTNSRALIRFNSDSGSNYSNHYLGGTGSAAFSANNTSSYATGIVSIDGIAGATGTSGAFGVAVIDIQDAFKTTKYKTVRFLDGQAQTFNRISLNSGNWRSTSAMTSLEVSDLYSNFVVGSRFSLYGLKAA